MSELKEFYKMQGKMMNALNKHVQSSFTKTEVSEMVDEKLNQEVVDNEIKEMIRTGQINQLETEG